MQMSRRLSKRTGKLGIVGKTEQRSKGDQWLNNKNQTGTLRAVIDTRDSSKITLPNGRRMNIWETINPGTYLVAETEDVEGGNCLISYGTRVEEGGIYRIYIEDPYKHDKLDRLEVVLKILYDVIHKPNGDVNIRHPPGFHKGDREDIRVPTPEELRVMLGVPKEGAVMGYATGADMELNGRNLQRVPLYHPLDDLSHGYTGLFGVGTQGFGKTTLLRVLAKTFSEWRNPPAVVVLDGEGEFLHLDEANPKLGEDDKRILKALGINSPCRNVRVYKLFKAGRSGTHTLSASYLRGRDIPMFLPDLPQKSQQELETICNLVIESYYRAHGSSLAGLRFEDVIREVEARVFANIGHSGIRDAVARSLSHAPTHLFDQGGQPLNPGEFLEPGRISVISDIEFDDREQVLVGLYSVLTLGRIKIDERLDSLPLVLFIDEATRRLPTRTTTKYVAERVGETLWNMVHVGRKRTFMPVIMTQHPNDVEKEIRELCGTQIVFHTNVTGTASWLSQRLKPHKDTIEHLGVGEALVDSACSRNVVRLKVPRSPMKEK